MALQFNTKNEIGQIDLPNRDGSYTTCQIYGGNALAIIVTQTEKEYQLQGFFGDKEHLYRCLGLAKGYEQNIYEGSKNIRLNTFYKEAVTLLQAFNKAGLETTTYYKKPTE